jgi:diguanylate cyclase (GGDEF)-like protein
MALGEKARGKSWRSGILVLWRVEFLAFVPAMAMATAWFGAEGLMLVAAIGLPVAMLLDRALAAPQTMAVAEATDGLTGLPLRDTLVTTLDRDLAGGPTSGKSTACVVICIEDAQTIAETHGQAAQDAVMRKAAERLTGALRENDVLVRIEGARFAAALSPVRRVDLEAAIQIAARFQTLLHEPYSIDGVSVYASVSIGFCLASRTPEATGTALVAAAELALEEAWRNGPGAIRAYSPEICQAASDREALREGVAEALEVGQIVAHYQPQLSTDTGAVTGFEALARWDHPTRGVLAPSDFLPAILAGGLSQRLSEVMLHAALNALKAWERAGHHIPSVAVNFAKEDLNDPQLADRLRWELDRFDLAPDRLTVEILESVVTETENDMVVRNIAALSKLGCHIDLDDFGTGHASISSIRRFEVDRIKIDRSFVTRADSDADQQKMIAAIVSMAERLGLETLAEGVESIAEHSMLAQLGCTHVQGFGVARPMAFDATLDWLERHRAKLTATPRLGRRAG